MVGTLLSTPDVDFSPEAVVGLDGGFQADGGQSNITIPGQTVAFMFLGTRDGENSAPEGLTGATVTLQPQGGDAVTLTSDGAGAYSRSSNSEAKLTYQSGTNYNFVAVRNGERFEGSVENSPGPGADRRAAPAGGRGAHLRQHAALLRARGAALGAGSHRGLHHRGAHQ